MENVSRIQDGQPFIPALANEARPAAPRMNVAQRRFMSTAELAGRVGLGNVSQRTALARLRLLHLQAAMPLPISPRVVAGELVKGAQSIHWRSQFDRGQMLAWIEDGASHCAPTRSADHETASRLRHTRQSLAARAALALPRKRECAA